MVRPWYRSRWLRIGGGLLLLGLIVAALIPFLVPVDRFRPCAWVGQLLGNAAQGTASGLGVRIPFSLKGTVDDPKFSLAGTPQPVQGQRQQTAPPTNLLDLFKPRN